MISLTYVCMTWIFSFFYCWKNLQIIVIVSTKHSDNVHEKQEEWRDFYLMMINGKAMSEYRLPMNLMLSKTNKISICICCCSIVTLNSQFYHKNLKCYQLNDASFIDLLENWNSSSTANHLFNDKWNLTIAKSLINIWFKYIFFL